MTEETYKKAIKLFDSKQEAEKSLIKVNSKIRNLNGIEIAFKNDGGNYFLEFGNYNNNIKLMSDICDLIIEHYGSIIKELNKKIEEL